MKQSSLIPTSGGLSLSPVPQSTGLNALFATHFSRTLEARTSTELRLNTALAQLTGTALAYTGALCALEQKIYETNPASSPYCRPLLEAFTAASAEQIWRFEKH